jgi:DNA-binding GntR family transcriptional regulator
LGNTFLHFILDIASTIVYKIVDNIANPKGKKSAMATSHSRNIFKEIEVAILSGRFKPRERLIEMGLMAIYGVGRTVIRETLKKLEAKGLVTIIPFRGAVITDLTPEEVEEIYFLRAILERIAADLAIQNITARETRDLKKVLRDVERHMRNRTDQMIEKDSEFHQAVFKACRNRYLCKMIDDLHTKAHIVRYHAWSLPQRIEQSIEDHRKMIRAIEKRDRRQMDMLVVKHLTFSIESHLSKWKGRGFKFSSLKTPAFEAGGAFQSRRKNIPS